MVDGAALALRDVHFRWQRRHGFSLDVKALDVARRERLLLVGPSGSGKSTLLGLICGINAPRHGEVTVLGQALSAMSAARRDRFRAEHIGVIFQMFNLIPFVSGLDNVLLALRFAPERRRQMGAAPADVRQQALALLDALGIASDLATAGPASRLSVGQQQRVAAARALIGAPGLIVADEPTSALDTRARDAFLDVLLRQLAAADASLLMVSHDEGLAPHFDKVVRLEDIVTGGGT